ncbi:hypothetical protein AK88_03909 [Plasmodium fragile]|uniref:Uncharacterized protein n=1 Tax=Plasmodium fragile TaxID=5857 RepID=A0A0D9QI15_PLAFR|nr:uncharacterized protein AK88_03909 [Plasmodium fragile]KJP86447.1 hypothetical protein AK88_03909 [Plasmodium fragile]
MQMDNCCLMEPPMLSAHLLDIKGVHNNYMQYYTDVLILSFVINLGLFYSFKFFYIYIVIPIYAIFKTLNFIFTHFLSSPVSYL